ncbi:MAG TPA: NAD(P)/FAD-dependent oxidoreductase [Jatrophihabitans sp.]|nr:NAD(P)/FAD-dependent oxidoreductase [Jatrophihabitans sp.]
MADTLAELRDEVRRDLDTIRFPDREWVIPATGPAGEPVLDVVVAGAGQCGLAVAFGLLRRRITNIAVYDQGPPGSQGPWRSYGRMHTLRSPKHFNGPDLDVPSLSCQAWYSAKHGEQAWQQLGKIGKEDWSDYLTWFAEAAGIPVEHEVRVEHVGPAAGGLLTVRLSRAGRTETRLARKVIFATGVTGLGRWVVPPAISENVPRDRYHQVAEDIDFGALAGKRIGVLGGGASAYDNAACALEAGARSVDLFFRRPELHRVNPHHWTEFAGFLDHFRDLPDEWRWRFMAHILPLNEPPPPDTFRRATRHQNFRLHLGERWERVESAGEVVRVASADDKYEFDHLLVAVGMVQDVTLQRELAGAEPHIARWRDRYRPPAAEQNAGLAEFPYLGGDFQYTEVSPGQAPWLSDVYNFTAAATVSHGPSGSSINGMKQAANRIADGICRDLFTGNVDRHYADLLAFEKPELDVPWP